MNVKGNVALVEPIRDLKQLNDMKEYLLEHNERDYLMFVLGINSGLRVSDILKLTVEDVRDGVVSIREKKTGKKKQFALSETCTKAIKHYLKATGLTTGTLFPSRKDTNKPITTKYAWLILKKAADWVGIKENIGTHTMRKTFGYLAFQNGADILEIMQCLNHSDPAVTMRYVGLTATHLNNKVYLKMNF